MSAGWALSGMPLLRSDYFDQLYQWAVKLIQDGKAYVDDLTPSRFASIAAP